LSVRHAMQYMTRLHMQASRW